MRFRAARRAWAVACLALSACGPAPTDTGFSGSWQRAGDPRSTISLREAEDGFRFRWSLRTEDRSVVCAEDGACEEFRGAEKVYRHRFRLFRRDGSPDLYLECTQEPLQPQWKAVRYVDRLALQTGGLELWSYTIEMDGAAVEPPRGPLRFVKVSDEPF
jgi:hypothetical protein